MPYIVSYCIISKIGGHDEQFERIKRDFESRSGAPHNSHQWEEWYQRNYKNPESHPFWEKEDARREQFNREKTKQSQDQETRNSKSYSFHNNPYKRVDPRRLGWVYFLVSILLIDVALSIFLCSTAKT